MHARSIFISLMVLIISFLFPPAHSGAIEPSTKQMIRFGIHVSAMGKMDPHFAVGSQDRAFADMVFNGLLRYKPGNAPQIEPDLAEKMPEFKLVDGKQIWTIELRKGVMFHAGPETPAYELTADDVVYSLNKSKDKKRCASASAYVDMTVKKTATHTVQIILDKPVSPILFFPKITNYGGGFIVSRKALETMGNNGFLRHPIGTGPFAFHAYEKGSPLILIAHDQYFRGCPMIDGVEMHFIPDIKDREDWFKKGKLDIFLGSAKKGWLKSIENEKGIIIDTHGVGEVGTLHFNTRMKPLDDIRVRQAIAYCLNRDTFLNTSTARVAGKVYSPVPAQFLPGGLSLADVRTLSLEYHQNIEKARQLMIAAGYPDGFTLSLVSSEKRLYRTYYSELKKQLAKINIACNIQIETHSNMHRQIRQDPKPMVVYVAWRPNADAYLTRFFHSDSIVMTGKKKDTNFSHYNKIDALIEAARLEVDPEKQVNLWIQSQIRVLNDMAAYPIMYTKQIYIRKDDLDYGHDLVSTMALYPQFTEKTKLNRTD